VKEQVRANATALLERLNTARAPSPRTRRIVLVLALVLFVGATALAVRSLPPLPAGDRHLWLFGLVAMLAACSIVVNGAEFALSARSLGTRVTLREATRISVLSTAANLLPIPGAAIVKTRALQRLGAKLRIAATLTIAIGIVWVGVAGVIAGVLVATTGHHGVLAAVLTAVGAVVLGIGIAILAVQKTELSSLALVGYALAIEVASVGLGSIRFFLVLRAIGFGGSVAQSATLAATAVVATAAGVFPGGLGLRELLSSAIGPAVGMSAAVATLVAAVERIVSLLVVALMALVVIATDRSDPLVDPLASAQSGKPTCA
jgi:hypothetical protein